MTDPKVKALLNMKNMTWTINCPYCGSKHTHGAGSGSDPLTTLGHRLAHCHKAAEHKGYYLVVEK